MNKIFRRIIGGRRRRIETPPTRVAVIGGGSWATAIVKMLSENNTKINWWLRNREAVRHIQKYRHNPDYLSGVQIHKTKVKPHESLKEAVKEADYIFVTVPAAFVRDALSTLSPEDFTGKVVISAVKGIIPDEHLLLTQYLENQFRISPLQTAVIAGPCHAEEVAYEKQSYLTIASEQKDTAQKVAQLLACRYIKTSTSADVLGVEYCAVMKNIIAIAAGITHGLNYGDNFQAVLVSNAMQEIKRFLTRLNPVERDLNGSAYLGDLLVTTYSQFSRNRTFGNMIGRGYTVKSAQMEMNMIAEGYYAVRGIYEIMSNLQVDMPITKAVYKILYEKVSPMLEIMILRDRLS
jgi:glycerol-3-phosphate dehydrogenase (NAD(P)+)